jgi:murein DD-endopeptidase MepM/ murein hydrolase activator NlpD
MHLDDRLVEVGEVVHKGQLIGYSGMSGTLTGLVPHLHLALWLGGGSVNPQPELVD